MKKQKYTPFFLLCVLFLCFCTGLFFGRNLNRDVIVTLTPNTRPATVSAPIDLNRADRNTLTTLPGIGEALANQILAYRDTHGPFTSLAELLNIDGIGPERLEALLPYLTTGG